jgi:carbon storage regulator
MHVHRTRAQEQKGSIMLVLSRRALESVVVGGHDGMGHTLKVTVLRVRGGEVRLGFDGPDKIAVHRLEVWERMHAGVSGHDRERPAARGIRGGSRP